MENPLSSLRMHWNHESSRSRDGRFAARSAPREALGVRQLAVAFDSPRRPTAPATRLAPSRASGLPLLLRRRGSGKGGRRENGPLSLALSPSEGEREKQRTRALHFAQSKANLHVS
ncbi:hypothetical protein SBV1_1930005 [Verrucomicrobia bacterium]|nr:hypothetical protein SBV1_1930005 [Verrucomicrobiota bacterium]